MKKNSIHYIIVSLAIVIGLGTYIATKDSVSGVTNVDLQNIQQIQSQENVQVIDVRTPSEFQSGHIAGAINVDWENKTEFAQKIEALSKDSTYILYCRSGRRSTEASSYMSSQGFKNVYNVLGGTASGELNLIIEEPIEDSNMSIADALKIALTDELHAKAFYTEVLRVYPNEPPFSNIIQAEQKHIDALLALHKKYGIIDIVQTEIEDAWTGTKSEACKIGVQAEIDNVKLYREKLLPAVAGNSDIEAVFTNLMNASEKNHLPAFSRCS